MSFLFGTGRYNPEIEVIKISDDNLYLEFYLYNADLSFANALRRIILAEIPTMAIDIVNIKSNTSVLFDEFISHRLGLIPIESSEAVKYEFCRSCNCKDFCQACSVEFLLKIKCDKIDGTLEVTTDHIIPLDQKCKVVPVTYPGEDPILICKLKKNQELDMHLIAKKGIAKEHSKWSPVCTVIMQQEAEIDINKSKIDSLSVEQKKDLVKCCPTKVFSYDEHKRTVEVENPLSCIFCEECLRKAESFNQEKSIRIAPKKNRFLFKVESNGSLKADQIVLLALKEMKDKLQVINHFFEKEKNIISNR
jgi:DNA-directed RNA polymerase II subunit RPB3